jgi:nitrate reductase NapAB chaperone NapD
MPILGLVLILDDTAPSTGRAVLNAMAQAPDIELGEPASHRWPAVLEAPDEGAAERRIEALRRVPGIAAVDVVYADFEDRLAPFSLPEELREALPEAHEEL